MAPKETLALTGFPFLSGFYSKDAIIEFAFLRGNNLGYYASSIGIFTALLTSIYSWRLIFKTLAWKLTDDKTKEKLLKKFEADKLQGIHIHCP